MTQRPLEQSLGRHHRVIALASPSTFIFLFLFKDFQKLFQNINYIKERKKQILKAIEQGFSQHMIAKVLGISQQAVYGVVKRNRK